MYIHVASFNTSIPNTCSNHIIQKNILCVFLWYIFPSTHQKASLGFCYNSLLDSEEGNLNVPLNQHYLMIVEPSLVETDPVMSVKRWTNSDRHGQQTNGDQKSSLEPWVQVSKTGHKQECSLNHNCV